MTEQTLDCPRRAGHGAQVVEEMLSSLHEALSLILSKCIKSGTVVCACKPSTQKAEAGRPRAQGYPWLCSKVLGQLKHMRLV